ncbi:cytochrome c [Neolewinella lacunae]|uniref:Cytochrome c n=1 Tax=Neolewinella lacunae TaxID=1517758 RepID=A0A923PRF8_9BACT|nr:cytochrome c [Neolewinella lacunae]MBC6995377.1 cytochrome c [Neolewinella lacunae]MDN3633089.1 cytochrome c [Neolewinella lacunae]
MKITPFFFFGGLLGLLLVAACTTDPILPASGIIPEDPIVIDPGENNPCPEGTISFQYQILPIMVASCGYSGCHDRASHRDGVVLVDYASVLREVRPGNANRSDLYESITENGDDLMPEPPAQPLTTTQKNVIRDWINQGAKNTDCGVPCDPSVFTFSGQIFPMLQDYCAGCHGNNRQDGGVNLSSHANILATVRNGTLLGAIRQEPSFASMPPLGSALSECRVAQVRNWIEAGAPNN